VEPFLEEHCYECHDDFDSEGGLNLLDLKFDPAEAGNLKLWEHVYERVESGEMPPKKKKRPEAAAAHDFLAKLAEPLIEVDRADLERNGRVHSRRLTREEYQNTIHELLGVDYRLERYLTAESEEGFGSNAGNQQLSLFHLDGYLRAGRKALDGAFERVLRGDSKFKKFYPPKLLATRKGRGNPRGPELREGKAIAWKINVQFNGRMNPTMVPESGWYDITVKGVEAINPGKDGVVWGELQSGFGHSSEALLFEVGLIEATAERRDFEFRTWIREGHILLLRPSEASERTARIAKGGRVNYEGHDLEKEGFAGIRHRGITIERVHPEASRGEVRRKLFGGLARADFETGGDRPEARLHALIQRFARKAFRRPVERSELGAYFRLGEEKLRASQSFTAALKESYHALLSSPRFLIFVEEPGLLDDHALASRLSYFLWKSAPDQQLRRLADEGKLSEAGTLRSETDRLMAHPKFERFVNSFTDQWLELREIDATQPDPKRFRGFDQILQASMVAETRSFIRELLSEDLSVTHLLKSDFGFLNTRLARHYRFKGLPLRPGGGLQRVALDDSHRSGLLTQGAILKVTADGSVTSPILRGVWINERILGRHIPPPPPNIPAVEPDIRGAISIRDQLAKHSNEASCAGCHVKIDPSGFALESYDPIGNFRLAYGRREKGAKVDPSGETPDGATFDDFDGWRAIYLERPEVLARAFARTILEFATGGELHFSDRTTLDEIVSSSGEGDRDYGLRSIIHACIASPIFKKK